MRISDWSSDVCSSDLIEEIIPANPGIDYPRFVDGERRAPPEDVGGTPGFEEFLNAMAKPRHPERASMVQWYGGVFDPTDISPDEINARMAKLAKRRSEERRVGKERVSWW